MREGKAVAGYWAVDVRTAGTYSIELRRWPAETGYALSAGIEGDDVRPTKAVSQLLSQ